MSIATIVEDQVIVEQDYGKNLEMSTTNIEEQLESASTVGAANVPPIPIHELLDRYELLYPDVQELADLRRSCIDHDLSSIFRLIPNSEEVRKAVVEENLHSLFRIIQDSNCYDADELYNKLETIRKAVVNKNLRSIFTLVGGDDLRKVVIDENYWKLWPLLEKYINTQFTAAFKNFYVNNTPIDKDCFSRGQLQSKQWLIAELEKLDVNLGTVFLCAGWYATLATMLFESNIKLDKVRSFDIDPSTVDIAKTFNKPWVMKDWKFQASVTDIFDINYNAHSYEVQRADGTICKLSDKPNTVINTSCEHIANFKEWYAKIPKGTLVILQSNNYYSVEEHVNCVKNIYEFKNMARMSGVLFAGKLDLEKYTRFMLIGYR